MKLDKNKLLWSKKSRVIFSKLLDILFVLVLFLSSYFGISQFILKSTTDFNLTKENKELYSQKVIDIGVSSYLFKYYEDEKAISTVEGLYRIYLIQNIKLCYETYKEIYKEDLDTYGYLEVSDTFLNYEIESYTSGFLEKFYLEFIIDKLDKEGNKIVTYNEENKYEYFCLNVLKVNEEGSEFFIYEENNYNEIPYLKLDVCRYLFQYNFTSVSYSTIREIDSSFYNYFLNIYNEAGELLLKYNEYKEALDLYEDYYNKYSNYLINTSLITYLIIYLIYFVLFPLLNKNHRSLSEILLNIIKLDLNKEFKYRYLIHSYIKNFIYSFSLFAVFILVIGGVNLVNFTFIKIGVFTINSMHLSLLSLIISFIFLIKFCVSKINLDKNKEIYYEIY